MACGNPERGDDGLGPALIERLANLNRSDFETDADYQLNIEDAASLANYERVLFIDASISAPPPFNLESLAPTTEIAFTSHSVSPGAVLAICHDHFHHVPEAWVLGIRGYQFDLGQGLSSDARVNLDAAFARVIELLDSWNRCGKV
ncbi:hydrogenase maturation protease [Novipirellula herctigrandis]